MSSLRGKGCPELEDTFHVFVPGRHEGKLCAVPVSGEMTLKQVKQALEDTTGMCMTEMEFAEIEKEDEEQLRETHIVDGDTLNVRYNNAHALQLLDQKGKSLKHCSEASKSNWEVALKAVKKDVYDINNVAPKLLENTAFLVAAVRETKGEAFFRLDHQTKKHRDVLREALLHCHDRLSSLGLGQVLAEVVAELMSSSGPWCVGNALSHLSLDLSGNELRAEGAAKLAGALASGNAPSHLSLNVSRNRLGAEGAAELAGALASGNAPSHLSLDLSWTNLKVEGAAKLANSLASGNAPSHLSLSLSENELGAAGAAKFANALASGNAPSPLALDLSWNELGGVGAAKLANSLASGSAPSHLLLDLKWNKLGAEGAAQLASSLASGSAPSHLSLKLQKNRFGWEGAGKLASSLDSGNAPSYLSLVLSGDEIGREGADKLRSAEALKKAPHLNISIC